MVSTLSLKNLQKFWKCPFQRLRTFGFYRVASKPFPEMLTMTNFGFKDFWKLCLAFIVSGFNFMAQKCGKKTENFLFQSFSSSSAFDLKVVLKPFSKMFSMSDFWFIQFYMLCLAFPQKHFQLVHWKMCKKI